MYPICFITDLYIQTLRETVTNCAVVNRLKLLAALSTFADLAIKHQLLAMQKKKRTERNSSPEDKKRRIEEIIKLCKEFRYNNQQRLDALLAGSLKQESSFILFCVISSEEYFHACGGSNSLLLNVPWDLLFLTNNVVDFLPVVNSTRMEVEEKTSSYSTDVELEHLLHPHQKDGLNFILDQERKGRGNPIPIIMLHILRH